MHAQSYYGTLKGVVKDATGSAVPNAEVTMTDVGTKITRKTVTSGSGEYVFNAVDPGTFNISVSATGFQGYERKAVVVATQQVVAVDLPIAVGSSTTVVEVTATEPLVDSATASNGQVFDTQKMVDLPNLGRNPFLLTKLNNNVTATGDPRFNRFQDQSGSSAISVAGGPINMNNYEVDGVPITDFSNRAVIIPSVEAVQEMKIQANTYDAEAGRTGGGNFNTLLKSGSNTLHGNLYGSTRQSNWAANTWNNNFNGTGRPVTTQYSYEGSVGGPIWKDRLFFNVTEEGYRQRSPLAADYYLPTDLERSGDFSQTKVKDSAGNIVPLNIYDPSTATSGNRTAYAGNRLPALNAVAVKALAALPRCVGSCISNTTVYGSPNFHPTDILGDRADEFIGKVDFQVLKRWLANASYMHYGSKEPGGDPLGSFAGASSSYLLYRKVDAVTLNNVITLTPTTVLTVGYGQNRFPNNTLDLTSNYNTATQLGIQGPFGTSVQKQAFPELAFSQLPQLGTNNSGPQVYYSRQIVAGIAKSMGRQSVKLGYVFRSISVDFTNVSTANGVFNISNTFTAINPTAKNGPAGQQTGADLADFLLGYPTSGSVQTTSKIALNVRYHAAYLQDDIRVNDKLSINAGLRYEYELGIYERNNRYAVGFDRNVNSPLAASASVATKGGIEFAGVNGYPTHTGNNSHIKFAPRAGFVYQPHGNMVVRGGYGVFYAPIYYSASASLAPGYTATTTYIASNNSNYTPANSITSPYATLQPPTGNSLGLSQGIGSSVTTIDQFRRNPIVQQYSFDIEQELPGKIALQIGYVGSKGRNLLPGNGTTANIDQINPSAIPYGIGSCPANTGASLSTFLGSSSRNPYAGNGGSGVIGAASVSNSQLCRPFPQFSSVSLQQSTSKSLYNALNVKGQRAFHHGLTVISTYTWSSNWDATYGQGSSLNVGANGPQNIYNLNGEYARAINNTPNRFTFGGTYELPFGRGKAFLSGSKWLDLAVGGWSANMTFIGQSGGPLPIQQFTNNNSSLLGTSVQRPNLIQGINPCTTGSVQQRLGVGGRTPYLNAAAFQDVPVGQFGNAPRTIGGCSSPGYRNADVSVFKEFQTERVHYRFQAEALNAFNTPQFALTSNGLKTNSGSFGAVSTNAINFPRFISLGGRISF
ncbi:Carboxypeptidase regulatory-like domain-containing protein [Terriglobus roseus]|uniref:Carboxypeptidase regulatory-like domain-containing protein n=2 Tax=Terriglobus roseus TaxID=392734 RepID=A0A1H4QZG2_9BACT|nr:Carboxypeptidase regulatory-like domain-containing protein [Terriglobus roseus]